MKTAKLSFSWTNTNVIIGLILSQVQYFHILPFILCDMTQLFNTESL